MIIFKYPLDLIGIYKRNGLLKCCTWSFYDVSYFVIYFNVLD